MHLVKPERGAETGKRHDRGGHGPKNRVAQGIRAGPVFVKQACGLVALRDRLWRAFQPQKPKQDRDHRKAKECATDPNDVPINAGFQPNHNKRQCGFAEHKPHGGDGQCAAACGNEPACHRYGCYMGRHTLAEEPQEKDHEGKEGRDRVQDEQDAAKPKQ